MSASRVLCVATGQGWYDHEFGGAKPEEGKDSMDYAWNWAAVQLDNGVDITAAVLIDPKDDSIMETAQLLWAPRVSAGNVECRLEPVGEQWTLPHLPHIPFGMGPQIPEANTELEITACVDDQVHDFD